MNTQAQSNGGKIGAAITNYKKRQSAIQAERRTAETAVATLAKCPGCPDGHDIYTIMLPPSQTEKGKLPRIYCGIHEGRRNLSEAYCYRRVA
jgi:hypothetical protein